MDSIREQWLILIATPLYLFFIGAELVLSHLQHRKAYSFKDTISNVYLMILNGGIESIISIGLYGYFTFLLFKVNNNNK